MELRQSSANPDRLDLSPNDFLSGEDLAPPLVQPTVPNPMQKQFQQINNVPDLHTVDINSTIEQRKNLISGITTEQLKQEIINEQLKQDVASVANLNPPPQSNTPKDILKSLVAKGNYQETIHLYGSDWTIRALDQRDLLLATELVKADLDTDIARINALIFIQVIFSIEAINGKSIYEWFPERKASSFRSTEEYTMQIRNDMKTYFEHFGPQVISDFYTEYQRIETKRNIGLETLKNS